MPYTDASQAAAALASAATSPQDLAEIAGQYPGLWAGIAAHPNAYDGLLNWLDQAGDEQVRAAVAIRRQGPPSAPTTPEQIGSLAVAQTTATVAAQQYPTSAGASTPAGQPSSQSGLGTGLTSAKTPKAPKTAKRPKAPKGAKSPQQSSAVSQPAPYGQAPQPAQTPPSTEPKKSSAGKVALIVGLAVVLVLGAAAAGYFLWLKPEQEAEESLTTAQTNFAQAVESYNVAQDKLRATIIGANQLLDTVQIEDVANPVLLTDLHDKTGEVEALLVAAPEMADEVEAIKAQVDDLTKAELDTIKATQDLSDTLNDVIRSLVEKSSEVLSEGIEKAQDALTKATSITNVDKERKALEDAINAAQDALDFLEMTQPDEVIPTVEQHVAALDEATKALEEAIGS